MMQASAEWATGQSPDDMLEKLQKQFVEEAQERLMNVAKAFAEKLQQDAQANRRWTDRTNEARESLLADLEAEKDRYIDIFLTGRAKHNVFLEVRFEKRFAIIWETIVNNVPELQRMLQGLLNA